MKNLSEFDAQRVASLGIGTDGMNRHSTAVETEKLNATYVERYPIQTTKTTRKCRGTCSPLQTSALAEVFLWRHAQTQPRFKE
jgi:hypothetical protein